VSIVNILNFSVGPDQPFKLLVPFSVSTYVYDICKAGCALFVM